MHKRRLRGLVQPVQAGFVWLAESFSPTAVFPNRLRRAQCSPFSHCKRQQMCHNTNCIYSVVLL